MDAADNSGTQEAKEKKKTLLHAYTQKFLRTDAFTHRSLYRQTLLHIDVYTPRRCYT